MNKFLLGCDPGASGGVAWFEPEKGAQAHRMPDTDEALLSLLRGITRGRENVHAVIELVGGYVKPARVKISRDESGEQSAEVEGGQPGSAMFKFGESAGVLRGILLGLGASVELVAPQAWMKPFGLRRGREQSKTEWKNVLKNAAQRRFPGLRVTLKTSDSLLILSYAALKYGQNEPDLEAAFRVGGSEKPVPTMPELFIYEWRGTPFVAKGTTLIRRASDGDLRALPKRDSIPGR